jgi:beta-fructofuranosidase
MPLCLPDKWVWDFWLARDTHHHIFYLQAPRSLQRSELRHHNASIGHAVSTDMRHWQVLPDALRPGPAGSWDDLATWTGSVIEHESRWHMLYTGISRSERGLIQRIGLAVSDDLIHWTKHPANPVLEADARWYEVLDSARWRDQSWRDPWLFVDPLDGSFRVLITARTRHGAADGAGVLAHARSSDLVNWDVLSPLTPPGDFAQVECPQLITLEDRHLILFSCLAEDHSAARRRRLRSHGVTGTHVFSAPTLDGPYSASATPVSHANGLGPLYAGKLVEREPTGWAFMAFRGAGDRDFVGELTDPLPLQIDGANDDLRLVVDSKQVEYPMGER